MVPVGHASLDVRAAQYPGCAHTGLRRRQLFQPNQPQNSGRCDAECGGTFTDGHLVAGLPLSLTVDQNRMVVAQRADTLRSPVLSVCRTAHGQNWTTKRVCSLRNNHAILVYREGERQARDEMSVSEGAAALGVTPTTVLRLIRLKQLPATQACVGAPWILRSADVERCVADRNHPATPPMVDSAQLILEIP